MASQPGIFQYGTYAADGFGIGYDDYGFGTDQIYTLPPFKVNENTGNDGTGLNNTFNDPTIGSLYDAGLTGGNIFTGGGSSGGGGVVDNGGYTDPDLIALYRKGLLDKQGYRLDQDGNRLGPVVTLPPFEAPGTKINTELDPAAAAGALSLLNSTGSGVDTGYVPLATATVFTGPTPSLGTVVTLPPFEVPGTKIDNELDAAAALALLNSIGSGVKTDYTPLATATVFTGPTPSPAPITLPKVEVPIGPNSQEALNFMNMWLGKVGNLGNPITLPAVSNFPVVTYPVTTLRITVPNVSLPPVTVSNFSPNVTYPPITSSLVPTTTAPRSTVPVSVTPSVPFDPNSVNTGVGTYGTNAQTLTTKRNFGAELAETLKALQDNQAGIMGMYGDLYKQFMPKGITDTESSIIDQYKTDLARLQQRQAGVLAPEDIRQSQQAAREAYGARGQVMGRGAVGAEIMGRENIRQQREDQARAGMQSSYGNIMKMADLQTGNIFSPIGNLMSNTFNPLSPYAADVYGTNVNAQLAKEIAQKNYDAAVRSAELSGAAQRSAATTSAAGSILGPAIGGVIGKGLGAIFTSGASLALSCMPGDQCIDTPNGPKAIKDLKGGDSVIGYDGEVAFIAQACSWNQNPLRTFLTITREDGSSFTVCDDHKIMGIPAMEWVEGAELAGSLIKSIEESTGLLTSYDILTNQGGYRINGIPVNSMIPEIVMQVVEFHRQVDRNLQAIST
jgi:hypothetical protein